MRRLALALGAAVLMAASPLASVFTGDGDAAAQSRRSRQQAAPNPEQQRTKGMADAPAALQAAGLRCTLADASHLGDSNDPETKTVNSIYEVACSDGPGYILILKADKTLKAGYECLQLRDAKAANPTPDPNALACKLSANADPLPGLAKQLGPLVPGCTVDQARWLGLTGGGQQNLYEVGCNGRPGALVKTTAPGAASAAAPEVTPCLLVRDGGNLKCELTSAEEGAAVLQTLANQAGRNACKVSDSRYVGSSTSGTKEDFFELKCADGAGFMVVADTASGGYKRLIECSRAQQVGGGCTLTDAVEAQNQEASLYKGLATKAGFDCDVSKYNAIGVEQTGAKRELIELQCNNQPESVVAFFPTNPAAGGAQFAECTKVGAINSNLRCSLTKPETIYARLGRDVASKGKTCQVTGYRAAGVQDRTKTEFVEVSCSGAPGLMVEYAADAKPFAAATGVFTCAEAANLRGGCKLSR